MWQINSVHAGALATGAWADPFANARMAYAVWSAAGRSWSPWTTYRSGAYRTHPPTADGSVQTVAAGGSCGSATTPVKTTTGGGWGGYANGRIPAKAMCRPDFDRTALLRCDAATALVGLNTKYRNAFGRNIVVTDSYRDYASQVRVKATKGHLAAKPGTSNHGWAWLWTSAVASSRSALPSTPGWSPTARPLGG